MDEGRYDTACPDLRESFRIDPAGGTQLTLAICYERAGKYASAWLAYLEALAFAQRDGRRDRERIARDQARKMAELAPHVIVRVPETVGALSGIAIAIDEEPLGRSGWNTKLAVDPGQHRVHVTAPSRRAWSGEFSVSTAADTADISVPELEIKPEAMPPSAAAAKRAPLCPLCPVRAKPRTPHQSFAAAGVGGAGLALLAAGAVFGVKAALDAADVCDDVNCPPSQERSYDSYRANARTANITLGIGLVLCGVSAVLFATSHGNASESASRAHGH